MFNQSAMADELKAYIVVDVSQQQLFLYKDGDLLKQYPVSTAVNGVNNRSGSGGTPIGLHRVAERYGEGAPLGQIFKSRIDTGKKAKIISAAKSVKTDDVTTRILWLEGMEPGKNQGGNVDSHDRYIYIHGTPEEGLIGTPASHGCIRMKNADVIELFAATPEGSMVQIKP